DANNNAVATQGLVVTWSSTNGGSFSAPTSQTNASGVATVSFTTSAVAATTHTVTGSDGTHAGTSAGFTTGAGAATKYLVTVNNTSPAAGSSVTATAQLADANDNPVATQGLTVTWSSTNGGSFSTPTSQTNASGIATVSFTTSTVAQTTHTVTGNDGTHAGTSAGFTTVAGTATKYLVTVNNASPVAGAAVTV